MTAVEEFLISCIKEKDIISLSKLEKRFTDAPEYSKYKEIVSYFEEHSEFIGVSTFCKTFGLESSIVDSKPEYYLKKVKERYLESELQDKLPDILRIKNPSKAIQETKLLLERLDIEDNKSKDVNYGASPLKRYVEYKKRIETKGITYLAMGHPILDSIFLGWRQNDLVTLAGRAGSKKTWLLCFLVYLLEEYMFEKDIEGEILLITNEISDTEIMERIDAIRFALPYKEFLSGTLSRREQGRYEKGLEVVEERGSKIIVSYNCAELDTLAHKIDLYKPKAVFIDGSYLLEPNEKEGWEKIQRITRALKRQTKEKGVPIFNTTQLGRKGGKGGKVSSYEAQEEFAFSNSYVADSDLALRSFQTADMIYRQEHGIQVAKGRRVDTNVEILFKANLHTMALDFEINSDIEEETLTEF